MNPIEIYLYDKTKDRETLYRITSFQTSGSVQNEDVEVEGVEAYDTESDQAVESDPILEALGLKLYEDHFDTVCEEATDRVGAEAEMRYEAYRKEEDR